MIKERIVALNYEFPKKSQNKVLVSASAKDLISKILVVPEKRITLAQIEAHSWFKPVHIKIE